MSKLQIPFGPLGGSDGITVQAAKAFAEEAGGRIHHVRAADYVGWVLELDGERVTAALVAAQLEGKTSVVLASHWSEKRG